MVYDHMVKKNGVYYQAWESVPDDENAEESGSFPPFSDSEITLETKEENRMGYTKSKISKMSTAELQDLAASRGIDSAFDMTGTDLKKRLIADMGL